MKNKRTWLLGITAVSLIVALLWSVALSSIALGQAQHVPEISRAEGTSQIEPSEGKWRTWVIFSGEDYRVLPPPGRRETRAELRSLADLISHNDATTKEL